MATQEGVCQAVFLEGGLSRDGRLQAPKLGLMDYMLRRFDPQRDRDIVFIPVGINYDRTIEDRSLLRSLNPDTRSGAACGTSSRRPPALLSCATSC
jgi:glycerol-3-phosphate O-acyltransferase